MSDDLVKRLRLIGEKRLQCTACYKFIETADEAADRIEKLEDELHHCFHRINELQAALRRLIDYGMVSHQDLERAQKALEGKDAPQEPV